MEDYKGEELEVCISFRADVYIKGHSLEEIKQKFEATELLSDEALYEMYGEFSEITDVTNAVTYEDITNEYNSLK